MQTIFIIGAGAAGLAAGYHLSEKGYKVILFEAQGRIKFPTDFIHLFHTHIFCQRGYGNFIFNDKPFKYKADEFVFWFADSRVSNLNYSKNFKATILLV